VTAADAFAYAIAGLLISQAVLRAKFVWNGRRRERWLWGAFAVAAACSRISDCEVLALTAKNTVAYA